jgi:fused signal recognition particle receptor
MAFNWFKKLKNGLSKSAAKVQKSITAVVGKKTLDQETLNELEDQLIMADLGLRSASQIVEKLKSQKFLIEKDTKEISESKVFNVVANEISKILQPCEKDLFKKKIDTPCVLLLSGVNGSGKTTTAGKISEKLRKNNKKVVIAACDTFRAAAVSQLETWAERTGSIFVKGDDNSDPAAVAYKSMELAIKEKADYLIIDTAGRLQNKSDLMQELSKTCRVLSKLNKNAPQEKVVVLDGTVGQNAHSQLKHFDEAIGITGIIVTKLDGTAKGGVIISLAEEFKKPIYAIGVGEKVEDLDVFKADEFSRAIMGID